MRIEEEGLNEVSNKLELMVENNFKINPVISNKSEIDFLMHG